MKKKIFFCGILLVLIFYLGLHYIGSVDVSDDKKLSSFIRKEESIGKVEILEKAYKEELLAVLYRNEEKVELFILEQAGIFNNRYRYFGGGSSSTQFDTYDYWSPELGQLMILYGNNDDLNAYSYTFKHQGKEYKKQELDKYVLDIYIFKDGEDIFRDGKVYDKDKQVISLF
ncbi:MAG: hypothetical protein AB9856_00990 [Cellulosilyticaceae bacterium]